MPPKPAGKGATKGSDSQGILSHAESLTGKATLQNETTGKAVPKVESATRLWSHALAGEAQREEVFKAQVVPALVSLLERGAPEERWAACGALHALAQSEKHITEVVTTKVISCAAALLSSTHDRSRQPAAQLLAFLAQRMEYSARVSDQALLPLLGCCTPGAITAWGGARITALHAVTALRALVENVQGEAPGSKVARRNTLIAAGAVPTLVKLVTYVPRLPEPRVVPAVPPVGGKKGGGSAGKGKKGTDVRPAAGRKDMIATHAAACLRFLALCPHFQEELLGCHSLGLLVQSLLSDSAEQAAYVCGILWELTADTGVAQEVCDHDGVKCLLHVVSLHLTGVKAKSKAKKKTDGQTSSKKADKTDPAAPPNYCEIAVCNALGALHHLTFLDAAKVQLCDLNGAAILVPCLKLANVQAFENATGALWNTGLHPDNTNSLIAAGVPGYLCHPVPQDWMVVTEPDIQPAAASEQLEAHAHTGPSFFLTQAT